MDLVAGAVGSIVTKLGELLHGEYKLQKGLPEQIEYLKNELESAHTALRNLGETPPEQQSPQVRLWAREVREASYDMEDILDAFLLDVVEGAAPAETKSKKGLLKRLKKMAKLLKESKARHDIAGAIEDMKKRLQEVWDRRERYSIPVAVPAPATKLDPRLVDMHKEATQIIGIERTRAELIAMLQSSTHGHGDAGASSSNRTKIVSVVGAGGLGKTTLAKAVYDELSTGYGCRAFVSVGRNPDLVQVFTSIFFGLDQNMYQAIRDVKDIQLLIGELRKFLENKRFFIVIDDVWDINSWQAIGSALDKKSSGSRIIKTTRNREVACSDEVYYKLDPLSHDNSKKLFYMRLYGGEDKCPAHHPKEASQNILDKCGGVPLAIITMASLLVGKSREDWFEVYSSPGFYHGRENKQVDDTVWILSLSYYDLPSHLKTCLLYLSVYPKDYQIKKNSLIWKWIAEGFIEKETRTSIFQRGEQYFHQLINRNMIQGVESEVEGIIDCCRVHDMVLDLIRGLAGEENFITISNEDGGTSSRHKVRRIAHQNSILLDQSHLDGHRDMTQLRSLVAHGCDIRGLVLHPSFKLLRVLALESCTSHEYGRRWLEHLGKLVHLRYLGLRGTHVEELPKAIGSLKLLQTLDLEGIRVRGYGMQVQLPSSVSLLTWLVCIRSDEYTMVPNGFLQKLTSLEELRISVRMLSFESERQFWKELGNLRQLRVLRVFGMVRLDESMQAELLKSLGNLQELQHLHLDCNLLTGITPASTEWDKAVLSDHLRHLYIEDFGFPCVPSFIDPTLLPNLCYLDLCVDQMDEAGLRTLGRLPELRFLLIVPPNGMASHEQAAVVNIAAHDVFFPKLRILKLYYWMVQLATNDDSTSASFSIWREEQDAAMVFDSKAEDGGCSSRVAPAPVAVMPNLHVLRFAVPVRAFYKDGHATRSDNLGLDLECLPSLRYVTARLDYKDAFPDDMDKAEAELRRQAQLNPNSSALTLNVYKNVW
ncbi:putative disease resistance RPP13-like protein 3 [Miscanthus floridulus]|uniref:putative disease resistance RPP13-like protein 3 n=1 Tax=Miscanthus floridulus TaxID=154761 RepID=UPI003457F78C